jgi:hypothetical protein
MASNQIFGNRKHKPSWRKGQGEPCARCGWAKRYHYGLNGRGHLIPAPELCSGFVSSQHVAKPVARPVAVSIPTVSLAVIAAGVPAPSVAVQ